MKLFLKIFLMVLFVSEIKFNFFLLCGGKNSCEHKRELPCGWLNANCHIIVHIILVAYMRPAEMAENAEIISVSFCHFRAFCGSFTIVGAISL